MAGSVIPSAADSPPQSVDVEFRKGAGGGEVELTNVVVSRLLQLV